MFRQFDTGRVLLRFAIVSPYIIGVGMWLRPPSPITSESMPDASLQISPLPVHMRYYPGVVPEDAILAKGDHLVPNALGGEDLVEFWEFAATALQVRRRVRHGSGAFPRTLTNWTLATDVVVLRWAGYAAALGGPRASQPHNF